MRGGLRAVRRCARERTLHAAGNRGAGALQVIPFDEFACAALGVVAYRVPLLARQVFLGGNAGDVAELEMGAAGNGAGDAAGSAGGGSALDGNVDGALRRRARRHLA